MGLIIKTTLKNIFGKPLRSLLVMFSIFVCAFSALFCFDLSSSMKNLMVGLFSEVYGDTDLTAYMSVLDAERIPEGFPECESMSMAYFTDTIYSDIPGEYAYVTTEDFYIYGVDTISAHKFGFLDATLIPKYHVIITDQLASAIGYEYGTPLKVHDNAGNEVLLSVDDVVVSDAKNFLFSGKSAVVSTETAELLSCGKPSAGRLMIDIVDDTQVDAAEEMLKEEFGEDNVMRFAMTDEMNELIGELFGLLFILFAVAFLLVIFITFSICERIVADRMSFIGTLRSLGLSSRMTALILLFENVTYAILGSVPGILLYMWIREPMYQILLYVESSDGTTLDLTVPMLSPVLVASVVIVAILIECLIPLKAVLKALKISIRDIIFDNRDTAYRFSRTTIIAGIVLAVLALVLLIFGKGMVACGICLIAAVIALSFLFPLILKGVTHVITKIAEKGEKGKLTLASREAISRKSTVSSGVLCATSATMCMIIYILASSLMDYTSAGIYDSDVVVTVTDKASKLSFVPYLDSVTDTEFVYSKVGYVYFGEEEKEMAAQFFGLPEGGYRYYHGFTDTPESIEEGTIYVDNGWAKRNGYAVGDTLVITFDPTGVFPIRKEYTIAGTFKIKSYESMKNDFLFSLDEFKSIYHDYPSNMLVRADDPETVRDLIKTYAVRSVSKVQTIQELAEDNEKETSQSKRVYIVVIAVALIMTCIGMITNQLIGFEGRKKECAVLISTSMTKRTLSGILFGEMLITSITSATVGCAFGSLLTIVIEKAVNAADNVYMPVEVHLSSVVTLWVIMCFVFALTVLFPIKNMRKMKLSEQLKYE